MKFILTICGVSIAIGIALVCLIRPAAEDKGGIEKKHLLAPPPASKPPRAQYPLGVPPEKLSPADMDRLLDPDLGSPHVIPKPAESPEK